MHRARDRETWTWSSLDIATPSHLFCLCDATQIYSAWKLIQKTYFFFLEILFNCCMWIWIVSFLNYQFSFLPKRKIQHCLKNMKIYERNYERKRLTLIAKVKYVPVQTVDIWHFYYQGKFRAAKWTYLYSPHINLMKPQLLHRTGCALLLPSPFLPLFFLPRCCIDQKSILDFWEGFCER